MGLREKISLCVGLLVLFGAFCRVQAQSGAPKFEVDPTWPKPLPENWVTGQISGVCVDNQDHVFIVNRNNITDKEAEVSRQAPPFIEFDTDGKVVNGFGDWKTAPNTTHGCIIDHENNFWTAGNGDGIIQKYSHDGKLMMQIGKRDVVDTSDGTLRGRAINSSHTQFNMPSDIAVDPENGDVYVADGYGNSRIAVFNREGEFLRQWGHQGTKEEADAGVGGAFMRVVHCVALGNDELVYVCDRQGDRIQVFDKMGNFKKNILVPYETQSPLRLNYGERTQPPGPGYLPRAWGTAGYICFSPDQAQRFMFVLNEENEQVDILDHASGKILSTFGRPGHQAGEFSHGHTMAMDSKGSIYVAEVGVGNEAGHRVQKFKIVVSR